ncbi:MarR family winged helix-turn-helix transcriptional regulator [Ramlibacter agri]|nr:MarR family transcriptional regulator [Ramlibacter agri]
MSARPPSNAADKVFYRPEDYKPEDSAAYLMRRILNVAACEIDQALEPRGLTHAQWVPLLKLHWGEASTVAELARECQLDAGAMTRLLDRLEAKGLVTRVRSSSDRRVVNLELTSEGRDTAKQIPAVLCAVQNQMLQPLSVAEWEQLRGLLRRVLDNALARQ